MTWICCMVCGSCFRLTIAGFVRLSDADEILKTIGLLQPDLILLDIKLDHGNGLDVCREIKNSYLKDTPVYIMSGLPDVEKKSYNAGADFFLAKPFDSETLLAKIRSLENSITGKIQFLNFSFRMHC